MFLDLSKASDRINHRVLLSKLCQLLTEALQWIQSFLTNQFQCVRANSAWSSLKPSRTRVPQGFWDPYLECIENVVCKGVDVIMNADVAVIWVYGREEKEVALKLSLVMGKTINPLCLTLNIKKKLWGCSFLGQIKIKKCQTHSCKWECLAGIRPMRHSNLFALESYPK